MKKSLTILCLTALSSRCFGFVLGQVEGNSSLPLDQTSFQTIQVKEFKPKSVDPLGREVKWATSAAEGWAIPICEVPGTYSLEFKGTENQLIELPFISARPFSRRWHLNEFKSFAVLLKNEGQKLVPIDPNLFIIPLGADILPQVKGQTLRDVVLASMLDPKVAQVNARLVRGWNDRELFQPMARLAVLQGQDEDTLQVRNDALYFLLNNRQVGALDLLPLFESDLYQLRLKKKGNPVRVDCYLGLDVFTSVPEALPKLNGLLFDDKDLYLRKAVRSAVVSASKKPSIPFLLFGVQTEIDMEQRRLCLYSLRTLIQKQDVAEKNLSPSDEIKNFLAWWKDELSGKHPHAEDDKDRILLGEGETHDAKELPQLNEALFMRDQTTRRAAVQALNKLADQSSVPYLIIALRDPQLDVAYGAHRILARLVPALGPFQPRATFDASRDQIAEAGVAWWSKHLQDAEEARLPEFMRKANKTAAK